MQTFILSRTDDAAAFIAERAQAARDDAADHAESRAELKARMSRERLLSKLAVMKPIDVIAGLHSVTLEKHGAALRCAWAESAEAFGDLLMTIVRDELEVEADLEAEEVLIRIEGAAHEGAAPVRRTFVIAGV